MRNVVLRSRIATAFCLIAIINIGCATSFQKVNADLLEQNRSKTYKLGIVKAAGDSSFGSGRSRFIEYRKRALNNIPIAEICSILNRTYSLNIDDDVDKTAKIVKEDKAVIERLKRERERSTRIGSRDDQKDENGDSHGNSIDQILVGIALNITKDFAKDLAADYAVRIAVANAYVNAYYGSLEYENESTILGIKNKDEVPDVVNVTYSLSYTPLFVSFYYDIDISSSGQEIVQLRGLVGRTKITAEEADKNQAVIWDSYVDHAGCISEALKRDLIKTAKK